MLLVRQARKTRLGPVCPSQYEEDDGNKMGRAMEEGMPCLAVEDYEAFSVRTGQGRFLLICNDALPDWLAMQPWFAMGSARAWPTPTRRPTRRPTDRLTVVVVLG